MATTHHNVWIRIAGDSQRMKDLTPPYWRYEIQGNKGKQYQLRTFSIVGGKQNEFNNYPEVNPEAQQPHFFAWLNYYCERFEVDDSLQGRITLGTPP